jgi:hypothetical protein
MQPDRYEPLPGFAELPGWLWRKAGRGAKLSVAAVLLAGLAAGVALVPGMRAAESDRAEADRQQRAERRAEVVRALAAEQQPRSGRAVAGGGSLPMRARQVEALRAAVLADARRRVRRGQLEGPVLRVRCSPFPRTVGGVAPERDLRRRSARYACVAIRAEFDGGVLGHPYRALLDFETGRYTYCKVSGQPGPAREQPVTVPRACGGR